MSRAKSPEESLLLNSVNPGAANPPGKDDGASKSARQAAPRQGDKGSAADGGATAGDEGAKGRSSARPKPVDEIEYFENGKERDLSAILKDLGLDLPGNTLDEIGLYRMSDLGADEKGAKETIAKLNLRPGDANRLLICWKAAQSAAKKAAESPKPLKIPDLPKGEKFDLSLGEIKLEAHTYKIPESVAVKSPGAWPNVLEFSAWDWLAIARRTEILHAVDLDKAFSRSQDQRRNAVASEAALAWRLPVDGSTGISSDVEARTGSVVTYSERKRSTIDNMMVGGEIHGACPFASGSVSAEYSDQKAKADGSTHLAVAAYWIQPHVAIDLRKCAAPSDKFIEALKDAIKADRTGQDPFEALERVFARFGHAVSTRVELGGTMYFTSDETVWAQSEKQKVEAVVKAAVDAKAGGYEAGGSASFKKQDGSDVHAEDMRKSESWTCHGGNQSLVRSPNEWAASLSDPNTWLVCNRSGMRSVLDWLDEEYSDLKATVVRVWEAGLKEIWGGLDRPVEHIHPILGNKRFMIKTGPNQSDPSLRAVDGTYYPEINRYEVHAFRNVSDRDQKLVEGFLWTLVYTGYTTGNNLTGEPYYFIVTAGSREMAKALRHRKNPGKYCLMLSSWDSSPEPAVHAFAQSQMWDAGIPFTSDKIELDELYWTVEPLTEDAERDDCRVFRVKSRAGRSLICDLRPPDKDSTVPNGSRDFAGYLRSTDDPKGGKIYMLPYD